MPAKARVSLLDGTGGQEVAGADGRRGSGDRCRAGVQARRASDRAGLVLVVGNAARVGLCRAASLHDSQRSPCVACFRRARRCSACDECGAAVVALAKIGEGGREGRALAGGLSGAARAFEDGGGAWVCRASGLEEFFVGEL